jgi:tripartite-type tricarboxylate transporter receptor subunit TctC
MCAAVGVRSSAKEESMIGRNSATIAILAWALIPEGELCAQVPGYPARAVRIVAPDAGSGNDVTLRLLLPGLSSALGQQLLIDNRGGGGGAIAMQTVAKAAPDGYTVLSHGIAIWMLPLMRDNPGWDPDRDFSPITVMARVPNILVVHPSLPVRSVKDLIGLAKARPGELNFGIAGGVGGATHLAAELFNSMAGIKMVRVSYKGAVGALTDLMAGRLQVMFPTASSVVPYIKAGRMKGLAVTTPQPSALAADLPTVAATGLPGYQSGGMYFLMAPARTPAAVITRLNQEFVRVLTAGDMKEKLLASGVEAVGTSPDELTAIVKGEVARMGKVIKDAGIRDE